jgi:hypothetical protein
VEVAQPVFELQVTVPPTTSPFTPFLLLRLVRPFTAPFSAVMVAVNVTDAP